MMYANAITSTTTCTQNLEDAENKQTKSLASASLRSQDWEALFN